MPRRPAFIPTLLAFFALFACALAARPATAATLVALGPPQPTSLTATERTSLATQAAGIIAAPGFQIVRLDKVTDPAAAHTLAAQSAIDYLVIVTSDAPNNQVLYDSFRVGPNISVGRVVRAFSNLAAPLTVTERDTLFPRAFKRTLLIAPETATDNGLTDKDFINTYIGALLNEKNIASYAATMEYNQFQTPTLAQQSQQKALDAQNALLTAQIDVQRQQSLLLLRSVNATLAHQTFNAALALDAQKAKNAKNKVATSPETTQALRAMLDSQSQIKASIDKLDAPQKNPTITFPAADIAAYAAELCRIYKADGIFVWHVARATYTRKLLGQYSSDVAMKGEEFNCNAQQVWSAKGTGQKNGFTGLGSALVSTFNLAIAFKPRIDTVNSQNAKPLVAPYLDLPEAVDKSHFDYDAIRIAIEKLVGQHP